MKQVKVVKTLAVLLLAAAVAAVGLALYASDRAVRIQGPSALAVVAADQVWIGVDDELWRTSASGSLRDRTAWHVVGLSGPPANLVHHPSGAVVASMRDDPALCWVDPDTARVTRCLTPRWPPELERHGSRAIHLAFHADGRFAIATGGGHAVALFAADGSFLARTVPGSYQFTNGLWWQGDALWTTDTNGFRLVRLDGGLLAALEVQTLASVAPARYLGAARAHPRPSAGLRAGLVRFENGMVRGRLVALGEGGSEAEFPHAGDLEPRDLDWLPGGELIASDGGSLSVLRWSGARDALGPFGDADLRSRWSELAEARAGWQGRYGQALTAAIGLFAIALALAFWAESSARRARQERAPIAVARLGTARVSQAALFKLTLRAHGWLFAPVLPIAFIEFVPAMRVPAGMGGIAVKLGVLALLFFGCIAAFSLGLRRLRRLSRQTEFEPMFNALAMRKLASSDALAAGLREGEQVIETFMWTTPGLHWVVLTDERLLVFSATLLDHRLQWQHSLDEVAAVGAERGSVRRGQAPLRDRFSAWRTGAWRTGGWLELALRNGQVLSGAVSSASVATRVAASLVREAGVARLAAKHEVSLSHAGPTQASPSARKAALASALVPGLGQWMQRRQAMALLMFVPWALAVSLLFVPIVWTLAGPRAHLPWWVLAAAAALAMFAASLAAWDAWRMAPRRLGRGR